MWEKARERERYYIYKTAHVFPLTYMDKTYVFFVFPLKAVIFTELENRHVFSCL